MVATQSELATVARYSGPYNLLGQHFCFHHRLPTYQELYLPASSIRRLLKNIVYYVSEYTVQILNNLNNLESVNLVLSIILSIQRFQSASAVLIECGILTQAYESRILMIITHNRFEHFYSLSPTYRDEQRFEDFQSMSLWQKIIACKLHSRIINLVFWEFSQSIDVQSQVHQPFTPLSLDIKSKKITRNYHLKKARESALEKRYKTTTFPRPLIS